jgi:hypothetical protein
LRLHQDKSKERRDQEDSFFHRAFFLSNLSQRSGMI